MRRLYTIRLWSLLVLLAFGCQSVPTATPPRPTATSPPATLTPVEITATASPTPVPLPTATPTLPPVAGPIDLGVPAGDTYGMLATAIDRERGLLYVLGREGDAGTGGSVLTAVDLTGGDVRASVPLPVPFSPNPALILAADGARLYVAGGEEPVLMVVSTGTTQGSFGAVVATLPGVRAMALDAAADRLYVLEGARLRRLNARTLDEELAVEVPDLPPHPRQLLLAVNPRAERLYLSMPHAEWVAVYRTADLSRDADVFPGLTVISLVPDPSRNRTYILTEQYVETSRVTVIRDHQVVDFWNAAEGLRIRQVVIDDATGRVLLLESGQPGQTQVRALDPDTGQILVTTTMPSVVNLVDAFAYRGQLYRLTWDGVLVPTRLSTGEPGVPTYLGIGLVSTVLDEPTDRLFVLDWTGTVHVLDAASLRVTDTWHHVLDPRLGVIRHAPLTVADGRLFVPDFEADVTFVLDPSTGERLATIPKGGQVTFDARRNRLFVTNQGVYTVDGVTYQVTGSIEETLRETQFSGEPSAMAALYDSQHDLLFATMTNNVPGSGARTWLQIYDGETLTRRDGNIETSQQFLAGLALDSSADRVWLASSFPSHDLALYTMDGRLVVRLRQLAGRLFLDAARQRLYVTAWSGLVTVDTATYDVINYRPLEVGDPAAMVYDARHHRLYATASNSASLRVIDPEAKPVVVAETVGTLPPDPIRQLTVDADGTPVAVNQAGGLFRAAGGGWLQIQGGLPTLGRPRAVAAPGAPGILFAFADDNWQPFGLFRSTDGGRSWHVATRGLTDFEIRDLTLSSHFSADGTALVLAGEAGVFRTRDGGQTWARITEIPGRRIALASARSDPPSFLLLAEDRETYEQTLVYAPAGEAGSVERIGVIPASYANALALSPDFSADGTALAGMWQDGLFLSQDAGQTWQPVGALPDVGNPTYTILFSSRFATDRTVYVLIAPSFFGAEGTSALLRSSDGGRTWQRATNANPRMSALAMAPDGRLWAGDAEGRVHPVDLTNLTWQAVIPVTPTPQPIIPPAGFYRPEGVFAELWAADAELRQALGWAAEPQPIQVATAFQPFEGGAMIWREDTRLIYALFSDGTWAVFDDSWTPDQPEGDPGIVPPDGRFQPVRGFGKVWRNNTETRARLGWALQEEAAYTSPVQAFEQGVLIRIGDTTYGLARAAGRPAVWYQR